MEAGILEVEVETVEAGCTTLQVGMWGQWPGDEVTDYSLAPPGRGRLGDEAR